MNERPYLTICRAIEQATGEPVSSSGDALCPSHEDENPSLSITEDREGKVLMKCHAGCSFSDIMHALGLEEKDAFPERQNGREILETYDYVDENGELLLQAVRYLPKDFRQRRPDGKGGWIWKTKGVRRVLYRLPKVLEASAAGRVVFVTEGEKDVHALERQGLTATTNLGGASKKWLREYSESLRGAHVVIIPDNDEPGRSHAERIARSVHGMAASVRILEIPGLPEKGDVSDYLASGGTKEELQRLANEAPLYEVPKSTFASNDAEVGRGLLDDEEEKKTHAEILLEISAAAEFFHTPDGDPYATFPVRGGMQTGQVSGRAFTDWLRNQFHARKGKPPAAQTLKNVVDVLAAKAKYDGAAVPVHLRIAGHEGRIYIDLCNDRFEAVEIGPDGWRVTNDVPVKFRRTRGMQALPHPERGGSLELLRRHVRAGDDFALLLAWLVQALRPRGPYPVLVFVGEQGTGKSTTSRIIRNLVDPSTVPIRSQPREERDLVIGAHNGWMLAYDNLSGLRGWLSDALCRISTGGGFGTRRLYENREEELFYELRPILLNGIEDIATRPDLADRCIVIELEAIPEGERKTETELWDAFHLDHPRILGALFDAVSSGLANIDGVQLETLPRMADFATWAEAALPGRGFLDAYQGNRRRGVEQTINSDTVAAAVASLLDENEANAWEGTTSELMETLKAHLPNPDRPPKDFPTSVQAMTARLRRIAPALRAIGIDRTDLPRTPDSRARIFRLERKGNSTSTTSTTSEPANTGQKRGFAPDKLPDVPDKLPGARPGARPEKNGLNGAKNGVSDVPDVPDVPLQSLSNDEDWREEMLRRADEDAPF